MNIQSAKQQIKDAVEAYLKKDDAGLPVIAPVHQRPMFLLGAPGIGKTAIMEQIAGELGIGIVSYSMTHHTRQSALGLPAHRSTMISRATSTRRRSTRCPRSSRRCTTT